MKILIVDDDEIQREFLRTVLENNFSAEVIEAKNGVEGLRLMKIKPPDLVILDLMMPILNGHNTLETMREDETMSRVPVIIVSGNRDTEVIKKIAAFGLLDYLLKPITIDQINEKITKFIKHATQN